LTVSGKVFDAMSLRTEAWQDPAAWGIMLADMAKHTNSTLAETKDSLPALYKAYSSSF
jgi:hypothetical protein